MSSAAVESLGTETTLQSGPRVFSGSDHGDHQIARCSAQVAVPEQQLDGAQVGACLQQVNREGVSQRVRRDRLVDAALCAYLPAGVINGERADWPVRPITRKQPDAGTVRFQ
jgi:hypothetical protein